MKDGYGRIIDYLRISLTDKCNLRCTYCMPPEGVKRLKHREVLTIEEIIRTAGILTELGIKRIRLTGGEPLVRKGVDTVVKSLGELKSRPELALTTNGILLADKLEEYMSSGLSSVNISLDTKDRECFERITGYDGLYAVERAIDKALSLGLKLKLNCVPMAGVNDMELYKIAGYARDHDVDVRYIELMPIGCAAEKKGMSSEEVLRELEEHYGKAFPGTFRDKALTGKNATENCPTDTDEERSIPQREAVKDSIIQGPARYVSFEGFKGRVGFISPLSDCFCASCNRLRLTVDGGLKTCLYYPETLDLKKLLRKGAGDEDIKQAVIQAVLEKPERHKFITENNRMDADRKDTRSMVQIGG